MRTGKGSRVLEYGANGRKHLKGMAVVFTILLCHLLQNIIFLPNLSNLMESLLVSALSFPVSERTKLIFKVKTGTLILHLLCLHLFSSLLYLPATRA